MSVPATQYRLHRLAKPLDSGPVLAEHFDGYDFGPVTSAPQAWRIDWTSDNGNDYGLYADDDFLVRTVDGRVLAVWTKMDESARADFRRDGKWGIQQRLSDGGWTSTGTGTYVCKQDALHNARLANVKPHRLGGPEFRVVHFRSIDDGGGFEVVEDE